MTRAEAIDTLNFQLRLVGQGAIKTAMAKLTQLAKAEARVGKDFESTDLEAAKALVRFGLEAVKAAKLKPGSGDDGEVAPKDLFDQQSGPWQLKKIE